MKERQIYYGTLEKTEMLLPVNIMYDNDVLIYESRSPFFGYYDDYPGKHNDNIYYYLVLEQRMTFVEMHRFILQANKELTVKVNMDHATLLVNHHTYTAVRLRYLEEVEHVSMVLNVLDKLGLAFSYKKLKGEAECKTKIIKYFDLDDIGDGLWIDRVAKNHGYIQLPMRVELDEFKERVARVRNNWDGNTFDAGLGVLCAKDAVIEVARIYSKSIGDKDYLKRLQQVFNTMF